MPRVFIFNNTCAILVMQRLMNLRNFSLGIKYKKRKYRYQLNDVKLFFFNAA